MEFSITLAIYNFHNTFVRHIDDCSFSSANCSLRETLKSGGNEDLEENTLKKLGDYIRISLQFARRKRQLLVTALSYW